MAKKFSKITYNRFVEPVYPDTPVSNLNKVEIELNNYDNQVRSFREGDIRPSGIISKNNVTVMEINATTNSIKLNEINNKLIGNNDYLKYRPGFVGSTSYICVYRYVNDAETTIQTAQDLFITIPIYFEFDKTDIIYFIPSLKSHHGYQVDKYQEDYRAFIELFENAPCFYFDKAGNVKVGLVEEFSQITLSQSAQSLSNQPPPHPQNYGTFGNW